MQPPGPMEDDFAPNLVPEPGRLCPPIGSNEHATRTDNIRNSDFKANGRIRTDKHITRTRKSASGTLESLLNVIAAPDQPLDHTFRFGLRNRSIGPVAPRPVPPPCLRARPFQPR